MKMKSHLRSPQSGNGSASLKERLRLLTSTPTQKSEHQIEQETELKELIRSLQQRRADARLRSADDELPPAA